MQNQPESLQDQLLSTLNDSKGNSKNINSHDIQRIVAYTIQDIEKNKRLKFSTDQTLEEIMKRCEKNSPNLQNNKKKNNINNDINIENPDSIQSIISKHQTVLKEIQDRLHHDVEMAVQQLGLIVQTKNDPVSDDENDFFVEEVPQATIIRHK